MTCCQCSSTICSLPTLKVSISYSTGRNYKKLTLQGEMFLKEFNIYSKSNIILPMVPFFLKQQKSKASSWQKNESGKTAKYWWRHLLIASIPDPDPPDPHVLGPPGSESGFISQCYGSGSLYQQAKTVRKTLIPTGFVTSFGPFIFEKWCKCIFKK